MLEEFVFWISIPFILDARKFPIIVSISKGGILGLERVVYHHSFGHGKYYLFVTCSFGLFAHKNRQILWELFYS